MIGVFDSGIGGLTVVRALMDKLPGYDLTYFGDTARTPYGNKSPETVIRYAVENTAFLLNKRAGIIVMGCNTASSIAADAVTEKFNVPVFEVVTPAATWAAAASKTRRIGVIGTRATVGSGIYEKKIKALRPDVTVYSRACPLIVPLVEEGWTGKPETRMIIKKYLHPLKVRKIDALILGCTHYPVVKEIIQRKIGKRVRIIDSSVAAADAVSARIDHDSDLDRRLGKNGNAAFYLSDVTPHFQDAARKILGRPIRVARAEIPASI